MEVKDSFAIKHPTNICLNNFKRFNIEINQKAAQIGLNSPELGNTLIKKINLLRIFVTFHCPLYALALLYFFNFQIVTHYKSLQIIIVLSFRRILLHYSTF